MFPILLEAFPAGRSKEKSLWARMAFIIRAVTVEDEAYRRIPKNMLTRLLDSFYKSFTYHFGEENCRPNIHVVRTI